MDSFLKKKSLFWEKERERRALSLFHEAAFRVPAYKDFLKKHGIAPAHIRTSEDFSRVPPVTKLNYLHAYPFHALLWDGNMRAPMTFSSTTGSTGDPFYFPRNEEVENNSSLVHELFLRQSLHGFQTPTLAIVGFSMGVWVGGPITFRAFQIAGERGYPVSVLPPGINKKEILSALTRLAPQFGEVILAGYPPFVKDVLEEAKHIGIPLHKFRLRLLFAAESFPEEFRSHVADIAGVKNIFLDTMNIYGSADIGTMAFETPLSILLRTIALRRRPFFEALFFSASKTPTFCQYDPRQIFFEAEEGELLLTGTSSIPLIRYAIGDHGGVCSYREVERIARDHNVSIPEEARKHRISKFLYELPFVYVFERKDFSTTIYGLQVYPEYVRTALLRPELHRFFTGKCRLSTEFDERQDQYLHIALEMKRGTRSGKKIAALAEQVIFETLREKSSEFRELSNFLSGRVLLRVALRSYEDPEYFPAGVKQRWVKR